MLSDTRILAICSDPLRPVLFKLIGPEPQMIFTSGLEETLEKIRDVSPDVVVSWISYFDGEVWSLVASIRTGVLCSASTPVIVLADQITSALNGLARDNPVMLLCDWDRPGRLLQAILDAKEIRDSAKRRALIIDDDPAYGRRLARILSRHFVAEQSLNGTEGFELWLKKRHDLVILDLHLPDGHGSEIHRKILETDPFQPVLVITAFLNPNNVLKSAVSGATHFVEKTETNLEILNKCLVSVLDAFLRKADYSEVQGRYSVDLAKKALASLSSGKPHLASKCLEWITRRAEDDASGIEGFESSLANLLDECRLG